MCCVSFHIDAASGDLWGDPKGCYLSLYNAGDVFRLLKDWNWFMDFADKVWK